MEKELGELAEIHVNLPAGYAERVRWRQDDSVGAHLHRLARPSFVSGVAVPAFAEGWPEPGPYVGRDAVMRLFVQARETWDSDMAEPISFIDAGDRVVMRYRWRGGYCGLG